MLRTNVKLDTIDLDIQTLIIDCLSHKIQKKAIRIKMNNEDNIERQRRGSENLEDSPVVVETVSSEEEGIDTDHGQSHPADRVLSGAAVQPRRAPDFEHEIDSQNQSGIDNEFEEAQAYLYEEEPAHPAGEALASPSSRPTLDRSQEATVYGIPPTASMLQHPEEEVVFEEHSKFHTSWDESKIESQDGTYGGTRADRAQTSQDENQPPDHRHNNLSVEQSKAGKIWFDDGSPLPRTNRRSEDPVNELQNNARRQSQAVFGSPAPSSRPRTGPNYEAPRTTFSRKAQQTQGDPDGGDDPPSDSSSTTTNSSNGPTCLTCGGRHRTEDCPRGVTTPRPQLQSPPQNRRTTQPHQHYTRAEARVRPINGLHTDLKIRTIPIEPHVFEVSTSLDREDRMKLSPEDKIPFDKQAGGYVLNKGNKLRVYSEHDKDKDLLMQNQWFQYQLKSLSDHTDRMDIGNRDVCTVVVPVNLMNSPEIEPKTYNLFDDYPLLTPEIVATSNAYYNRWVDAPYIKDNLTLLYNLCKSNTEEILFAKSLEMYEEYHPMQQGGTLIFQIVCGKIHTFSEQKLEYLKLKVETLRISSLEGENVETAVSLLNAAYKTFHSVSTPTLDRLPREWSKTLIKVLQTTSVPAFNKVFALEASEARRDADKNGGQPIWPSHEQLVNLATAVYRRMSQTNQWNVSKGSRHKALTMAPVKEPRGPPRDTSNMTCWNCGKKGHSAWECKKPKDPAAMERNRKAFRNRKPNGQKPGGANRSPRHATIDGKPMIMNKQGAYVLDQKLYRAQQQGALQALAAMADRDDQDRSSPPELDHVVQPQAHVAAPQSPAHVQTVQEALRHLIE